MSSARRNAQKQAGVEHRDNLIDASTALRNREAWKYVALQQSLAERPHQFEFPLGGYVYDLVLFDTMVVVEFDGPDHGYNSQKVIDTDKESVAKSAGYILLRRGIKPATVIDPSTIEGL